MWKVKFFRVRQCISPLLVVLTIGLWWWPNQKCKKANFIPPSFWWTAQGYGQCHKARLWEGFLCITALQTPNFSQILSSSSKPYHSSTSNSSYHTPMWCLFRLLLCSMPLRKLPHFKSEDVYIYRFFTFCVSWLIFCLLSSSFYFIYFNFNFFNVILAYVIALLHVFLFYFVVSV